MTRLFNDRGFVGRKRNSFNWINVCTTVSPPPIYTLRFSSGDLTEYDDPNGDPQQQQLPSTQNHQQPTQQPPVPPRPTPVVSASTSSNQLPPQQQQQQVGLSFFPLFIVSLVVVKVDDPLYPSAYRATVIAYAIVYGLINIDRFQFWHFGYPRLQCILLSNMSTLFDSTAWHLQVRFFPITKRISKRERDRVYERNRPSWAAKLLVGQ